MAAFSKQGDKAAVPGQASVEIGTPIGSCSEKHLAVCWSNESLPVRLFAKMTVGFRRELSWPSEFLPEPLFAYMTVSFRRK